MTKSKQRQMPLIDIQPILLNKCLIGNPMLFCMVSMNALQKTSRHKRQQNDVKAILETLSSIKVQINPDHIIDCFRLGKFKQNQSRPRPILIKLQRTMDVNTILANKSSLPSPLIIKPDMSPQERAIESVLLKERWSLIKAGHNRKQIKLSSNHIFVNS